MLFSIFKEFYEIKSSLTLFICYLFAIYLFRPQDQTVIQDMSCNAVIAE